ncbi:50S ribosomal protein L25/general stress protein Ctc [Kurthia sibirica]|uniref:Large ribosomal subunit protein bL25 n=1 Tax=Kurthia sibirica TaxID=202750 RepID=A0A2U3AIE1_9BACL|nr:50S ribosomal protein L25/general stress protein Ctc [Kurthia sibirica]PWI24277.1 50S ribosomal protein L25 [Kurthia sibirica]GEK34489.1 50S ribosomal protein L25 [Kurthia sibirica]
MSILVHAKKRDTKHRSEIASLRQEGYVPAVVYGYQIDTTPIAVDERDFEKTLREDGRTAVMLLSVDGVEVNAVLAEVQKNPVKGELIHLDFLAVNMNKKIELEVPIQVVGEPIGVKEGGSLQMPNRELLLKVEPKKVPDSIEVNIADLAIGESVAVGDIRDTVEFEIIQEDDYVLATVLAPITAAELEASLGEAEVESDTGEDEQEPTALKDSEA